MFFFFSLVTNIFAKIQFSFQFSHQIDTFVNPLRSSMRNVSNAVKALPDSLAEGMTKVSDNMGRMSERLGQDIKQSILKVKPSLLLHALVDGTSVFV